MNKKNVSPYVIIILGFIGVILIGTLLLLLPFATKSGYRISFIDALFTSTSAVCVTGLLSVESVSGVFTLFGKIVITLLIEVGGIGIITITVFLFTLIGIKIGMHDRFLIKESLNQNSLKGMVRLVRKTVEITLIIQLLGAIVNFIAFRNYYNFWDAFGVSIFHSISAFNNAGFDLFGNSLINYKDNILINLNSSFLIILGGIGFIVIYDIFKNKKWKYLSIHTKIVLKTSLILIISGMVLLKISEGSSITWLQAYFSSVSARTAGFAVVDFNTFTNAGLMVILILMYIGASPSSTAGGIKVTTFYTVFKFIISFATGKETLSHNRKVAIGSIVKAFVLIVFSLAYISIVIFLINFIEKYNTNVSYDQYNYFTKIVFEVVSAFGTVGYSMGITEKLHWLSKLLLCITMIFGRLGPITIISAWNKRWNLNKTTDVKYLEEHMIIG